SNVFLCGNGQTKVLDLGLAQLQSTVAVEPASEAPAVARAGTPRYMAPELFAGHTADRCSDVYAVGCMLLDTLVGSSGEAWIARRVEAARVPPVLRRLLRSATASERAERFRDASELLTALTRAHRQLAAGRRTRRAAIAIAAALGALGLAIVHRSVTSA